MYVIYKIYYKDVLLYVGSTTDLKQRKWTHKHSCYNENRKDYNMKLYQYIRDNNIVFEDLIWNFEETDITDKTEALKFEGSKILELNPICNYEIAGNGTGKEWRESNKEKISEQKKQYREANKEKLREYHKQWREDNKEQRAEYRKQYYEKNKDEYNKRRRERRAQKKKSNENI
jgi:predicted GIY-YIG superfamily endonuclease